MSDTQRIRIGCESVFEFAEYLGMLGSLNTKFEFWMKCEWSKVDLAKDTAMNFERSGATRANSIADKQQGSKQTYI